MAKKKVKTEKDYEKHLLNLIDKWTPILLLQRHIFKVKKGCESKTALMECVFNYPYLNVRINYSVESFEDWSKGKDIENYIVHEMCHVITDPLYSKALDRYIGKNEIEDERERLTDLISHIVIKQSSYGN